MGEPVAERMRRAGRDLYIAGLVSTRSGNLSVRIRDTLVVTRAGASLPHLRPEDLVEVPAAGPGDRDGDASSDLAVHRAVYARSSARAVVHAHPPLAVVLSFGGTPIVPADHEGRLFIPSVPVVDEGRPRVVVGDRVGEAMADGAAIVAVRGHGTYAAGDSIEAATHWTTSLELSARIVIELRRSGISL